MIKHNEELYRISLIANEETFIDLLKIYPLGKIDYKGEVNILTSFDNSTFKECNLIEGSFNDMTARYLKITSSINQEIVIYMGLGYYVERNDEMTKLFERKHGWCGGDGIYSFNLDEEEDYDQKNARTLFVFGDTFYGHNLDNKVRMEPQAFLNNSLAYYQNGQINFEVAKNSLGALVSLFEPNKKMQQNGFLPKNLTTYDGNEKLRPYVSSMDFEKDIEIIFSLNDVHQLKKIEIENFHAYLSYGGFSSLIGVQCLDLYVSNDGEEYHYISSHKLDFYEENKKLNVISLDVEAKYVKFVISKKDNDNIEKRIGLKKVFFYDQNGRLFDVSCTSNSEFSYDEEKPYSWFWLQDGVIHNNKFYIYPCIIEQDKNGIEGFEFKIKGVAKLEMNIVEGMLDYKNVIMDEAPLYRLVDDKEYILPTAIYSEGEYYYFYGYFNERSKFLRNLIVGRIKKDKLHDLNNLEYYTGRGWDKDFLNATSLVRHVSCEMSVQKIVEGENNGKYLAIFQYDTNGPFIAYSIGETPWGPFSEPHIIYKTPEVDTINKGYTYTYNAKSHLHLSSPKKILVSYNTNDTSMANNKNDYTIYHPRFLNFISTSND